MFTFAPPANADDLNGRPKRQEFLTAWHSFISDTFRDEIKNLKDPQPDRESGVQDVAIPYPLFFSEADTPATTPDTKVPWDAFPLSILRSHANDAKGAWKAAETLGKADLFGPDGQTRIGNIKFRVQDEYCEWFADVSAGKLTRISFTAEAPEYWLYLNRYDKDAVLDLYRKFVSSQVQPTDLVWQQDVTHPFYGPMKAGDYNPHNVWNTEKGVMHLTHRANTLGAEINLAAQATRQRIDSTGALITDPRALICCSG